MCALCIEVIIKIYCVEASRAELISTLAEDLKQSDQDEMSGRVDSPKSGYAEEEILSATNKNEVQALVTSDSSDQQVSCT